jgi:lysophospholipase L1-like esterase
MNAEAGEGGFPGTNKRRLLALRVGSAVLLLVVFLLGGEVIARLDDTLFFGVPFFSNPTDDDLTTHDWFGRRGRAHGQFGKWKLNSLGFRGPEITVERAPACARIVVLGASETFGYLESPGHEYPSLLARKLAGRGCVEVVNAAVVGMIVGTMQGYWTNWVARLHPDVVLIYPSPLLYLGNTAVHGVQPRPVPPSTLPSSAAPDAPVDHPFESRFLSRVRGYAGALVPRWVNMYRLEHRVRATLAALPPAPDINSPPAEDLAAFRRDLNGLIECIRSSGARVILLTHAERAGWPIERRDIPDLWAMRAYLPHASLPELVEFDRVGNAIIRETAQQQQVQVIDTAAELNGRFDSFGDLVHFNDKGADTVASLIAQQTRLPSR